MSTPTREFLEDVSLRVEESAGATEESIRDRLLVLASFKAGYDLEECRGLSDMRLVALVLDHLMEGLDRLDDHTHNFTVS